MDFLLWGGPGNGNFFAHPALTSNMDSSIPISPETAYCERAAGHRRPFAGAERLVATTLLLLWAYAVYRLGTLWHSDTNYKFGWFVPLLALALGWERWRIRPSRDAVRPAEGTFLLLGICAVGVALGAVFLEVIPVWRFAGWIFAVPVVIMTIVGFYFLGGKSWSRHFTFPVLFFLVAVPWPSRFEQPLIETLSQWNAAISVVVANLLGVVAMAHGTLVETGGGFVGVDDACSGIRSFQSSVMMALFLGELFRYSPARRLVLLVSGVGFAFACNVARTTYLVCTCDLKGLEAVNLRHDEAGFTILGVTLAGLLVMTWLLRPRKSRKKSDAETMLKQPNPVRSQSPDLSAQGAAGKMNVSSSRGAAFAMPAMIAVIVWIVAVEAGIELWFGPAENQAAKGSGWTFQLPAHNLDFSEVKISDEVRKMLAYDEGEQATWRDIGGHHWQMFYFRWLAAPNRYRAAAAANEAYGHAPDVCLRNAGMILETNFGTKVVEFNGVLMRVYIEKFLDEGRYFHVATCNWEPTLTWLKDQPTGEASTGLAMQQVAHAVKFRNRNRLEKRVLKVGVWDMEKDEDAESALHELLRSTITK